MMSRTMRQTESPTDVTTTTGDKPPPPAREGMSADLNLALRIAESGLVRWLLIVPALALAIHFLPKEFLEEINLGFAKIKSTSIISNILIIILTLILAKITRSIYQLYCLRLALYGQIDIQFSNDLSLRDYIHEGVAKPPEVLHYKNPLPEIHERIIFAIDHVRSYMTYILLFLFLSLSFGEVIYSLHHAMKDTSDTWVISYVTIAICSSLLLLCFIDLLGLIYTALIVNLAYAKKNINNWLDGRKDRIGKKIIDNLFLIKAEKWARHEMKKLDIEAQTYSEISQKDKLISRMVDRIVDEYKKVGKYRSNGEWTDLPRFHPGFGRQYLIVPVKLSKTDMCCVLGNEEVARCEKEASDQASTEIERSNWLYRQLCRQLGMLVRILPGEI